MVAKIYQNIIRLISEQNISIRQFEIMCGLGNGTISGIETGNPTIETLEKIANSLDCTVSELIGKE